MDNKCNCIKEVKNKVRNILIESNNIPEEMAGDISMSGELYSFEKGVILASEMVLEYKYKAKTSGNISNKKAKTHMQFSYCPFCGVEY